MWDDIYEFLKQLLENNIVTLFSLYDIILSL